jgi:hypothetical protein
LVVSAVGSGEAGTILKSALFLPLTRTDSHRKTREKATPVGETTTRLRQLWANVVPAAEGVGPLLQRDYWAVLRACPYPPPELATIVREHFTDFPPGPLVVFRRTGGGEGPLDVGDELEVEIRLKGTTAVRVVHVGPNSLTLATVEGHPEAGRITFGAYRSARGDVVFHIRSRARSSSSTNYAGFLTAGEAMQTKTWTDFIDRLAHAAADGIVGAIYVETREVEDAGHDAADAPTFVAEGD